MPELPEVEAIRRVIEPQIQNHLIEHVSVRRPEVIAHPGAETFCSRVAGQRFAGMERRGKFLIFFCIITGFLSKSQGSPPGSAPCSRRW